MSIKERRKKAASIHTDSEREEKRGSFGYSDSFLFKFMFRYMTPYRAELILVSFIMLLFAMTTAVGPIVLMAAINRFTGDSTAGLFGIDFIDNPVEDLIAFIQTTFSLSTVWAEATILSIIYLVVQFLVFILNKKQINMIGSVGLRAELAMRLDMFRQLQELDLSYHDKNEVGRIMSRLTSDLTAIREMLGGQVILNIANLITVVIVMVVIYSIDPVLSLVPTIFIPIVFAIGVISRRYTRERRKETRRTNSIMMANIGESIAGIKVTKGHNREGQNIEFFRGLNEANRKATIHADDMNAIFFPILLATSFLGIAFIVLVGGIRLLDGLLTIGVLVAFLNYNIILFRPVILLGQFYQQLQDALTGAERVYALLDTKTKVPMNRDYPDLPPIEGEVLFEKIKFEYVPGTPVYQQFSLMVPAGHVVAFVGKTGAGKSTIINILSRMYEFQEGVLKIDGRDITNYSLQSYRRQIAAVPQDFFLLSASIRENLRLGDPQASEEDMFKALEAVGLEEYVRSMENGLDTPLQERGGRLSVGQRQLIVFAAVLLANPRILILDEATSSIDVFSELKIQKAIKLLLADRTAFIIAHRLSTIRAADTIVVIDEGDIVEQGTHDELIQLQGHYHELVKNQIQLAEVT
ncbi:MAG: ABC transporter ATP-binding protein [Candidatus Heimdallarchaeota archaeon]|nr:ABC transporter ATP-binding protein [Candidatus Heimdallarchaeota archaeon]